MRSTIIRFILLGVMFLSLAVIPLLTVGGAEAEYTPPAHLVDGSLLTALDGIWGLNDVSVTLTSNSTKIAFYSKTGTVSEDPYLSLTIPEGVNLDKTPYLAMLVKTDKHNGMGQMRFQTERTGGNYPCHNFYYQKTDEPQLIMIQLTDKDTVQYVPGNIDLGGKLTVLRIDPFDTCPTDTSFEILGYGFYENSADAQTFAHFTPEGQKPATLPDVDYASFWRGTSFASPSLDRRMTMMAYGFYDSTPVDMYRLMGYGGIVSNVAFEADYLLNDRQFAVLDAAYKYAQDQGMVTWIYDEYQWPSGKAFGQVLQGHDEYEATGVEHRVIKGKGAIGYTIKDRDITILRADLTTKEGKITLDLASCLNGKTLQVDVKGEYTLDLYVHRYTYEGVEDPTDFTTLRHVDLLNPDAVARFIELTHERYKDKMPLSFTDVDAFFTDEPQLGNRTMTSYVVWTEGLAKRFRDTWGYDIDLAALFRGDSDDDARCRMHFYKTVSSMFKEAYFEQITTWCEKNGVNSSGHLLFEEGMTEQIETYGGDFLSMVGAMSIPGVDLLWVDPGHLMSRNPVGNVVGTRYVSSAAKNEGKDRVFAEFNPNAMNTLSKEDPLGECIAGASVLRLLGVTDYTYGFVSVTDGNRLNDYVGRLNTLLDGTKECGNLAVFYPISTVQSMYDADTGHTYENMSSSSVPATVKLDTWYQQMCMDLLRAQYLYTVLDDDALSRAKIADDGCLVVGNGAYQTIILPSAQYISAKAMENLVAFKEAGGNVIFVGKTPEFGLRAEEDAAVKAAMQSLSECPTFKTNSKAVIDRLDNYVTRSVTFKTSGLSLSNLLVGEFSGDGKDILYLTNIADREGTFSVVYTDGYAGNLAVYTPRSGMIETMTAENGKIRVTIGSGEAVLVVREGGEGETHLASHTYGAPSPDTAPDTDLLETEPPVEKKGCFSSLSTASLLLVFVMILSLSLLSCKNDVPAQSDESTTAAQVSDTITLATKGEKTDFQLVIANDATGADRAQALRIRDAFKDRLGVTLSYVDDYYESDEAPNEIIVCAAKRAESAELSETLDKDDYVIKVVSSDSGTKILICATSTISLMRAVDVFLEQTVDGDSASIPVDYMVNGKSGLKDLMITSSIDLRDPCILRVGNTYYCYGTGYNAFKNTSGDLSGKWEHLGPFVTLPADADGDYWAPEVHAYNGAYYLFATYKSKSSGLRGCSVFKADKPEGPFVEISSGHITPKDMECIDATLYIDEDEQPWMVFVREWTKTEDGVGRMMGVKLNDSLTSMISEPIELFRADDAKWATQGVTDGCWLYRCQTGELLMIWSNFEKDGYCIGIARSDNGKIDGNWTQEKSAFFERDLLNEYDGGHGMIFADKDGQLYLSLHSPNAKEGGRNEKPIFIAIREEDGTLVFDPCDSK